jgi:hypothetical protein
MAFVLGFGALGIDTEAGQQGSVLPATTDFKEQAPRVQAIQAYRQAEMQLAGWEPLMPTLFLPAAPKSATTWLYGCMDNTFGQDQLCQVSGNASSSEVWAACDKKFFLPAHVCNQEGRCHPQKEAFWFQQPSASDGHLFGPRLPLEFFSSGDNMVAKDAGNAMKQACDESPDACSDSFLSLPWVQSARKADYKLPSGQPKIAIADFTPNYLCSPTAMKNIAAAAKQRGVKDQVRFIVSFREPLERAFSEWSMFALSWEWDKTIHAKNFSARMEDQVEELRLCNKTLFRNTELLSSLPDDELFGYVGKCFGARAMEYVGNSLYSPCLLMAKRIFQPDQFHVIRYEDLYTARPAEMVSKIAAFTGLHLDEVAVGASTQDNGPCHFNMAGQGPMHMSTDDEENKVELHASEASLAYFFRPYNELLTRLARPDFGWSDRPVFRWLSVRRPPTPIVIPGRMPHY